MGSWLCDVTVILTIVLLIPALISVFFFRNEMSSEKFVVVRALIVTAAFTFLMLSRPSQFIWERIELLQKIQFPWRFLSVLSLMCVVSTSICLPTVIEAHAKLKRWLLYPMLAIIVCIALFDYTQLIVPSAPYTTNEFHKIVSGIYTDPIWEGWLPIWANKKAFDNSNEVNMIDRKVKIQEWNSEEKIFSVDAGPASTARIAAFYYPYWNAYIDNQPVEVGRDQDGLIEISVPDRAAQIRITFEEPSRYRISYLASAIAWMLLIFAWKFWPRLKTGKYQSLG
jgi:uncharacterized membrane protein YfhO